MTDIPDILFVNHNCALVKDGSLYFSPSGKVDRQCKAFRHGWVRITDTGHIDRTSSSVRDGDVTFVSTREATMLFRSWKLRKMQKEMKIDWNELWIPPIYFVNTNSQLIQKGHLQFTSQGLVDETSIAVQNGKIILDCEGHINPKSFAVKKGELILQTEKQR